MGKIIGGGRILEKRYTFWAAAYVGIKTMFDKKVAVGATRHVSMFRWVGNENIGDIDNKKEEVILNEWLMKY